MARPMGTFYAVVALAFTTHAMMAPLVPLFGLELGASPAVIGLLVSAGYALPLFLAIAAGSLVDRRGPRPLIIGGAIGLTVSPLLVAVLPGLAALVAAQLVLGSSHLLVIVAAQAHVASRGEGRATERSFGWYTTFVSIGQLTGPLLAGLLIDATSFPAAFALTGLVAGLGLLSALFARIDAAPAPRPTGAPPAPRTPLRELLRNPGVRVALLVSSGALVALSAYQAFVPVYLERLAFSPTAIGALLSLRALASMAVRPLTTQAVALFRGRLRSMVGMLVLILVGVGFTGFASAPALLAGLAVLFGIGAGLATPLSMAAVVDHVERRIWGFALGVRLTGNRLAQVTAPAALGVLAELAGFRGMFLATGLLVLLAAVLTVLWGPAFERAEGRRKASS